jgi:RNase P subunit RPR2
MGWICEHCSTPFEGSACSVKSEESGVVLLNMVVCHTCREEAEKLGLHTEKLNVQSYLEARRHKENVGR